MIKEDTPVMVVADEAPSGPWATELPAAERVSFGSYLGVLAVATEHRQGRGWQPARMVARSEITLSIASAAIQGGLSAFEGLKAFRQPDGSIALFCGQAHARRLRASASRLSLADVEDRVFLGAVGRAVEAQASLVPAHGRGSLYLRPTLLAADQTLGLRCSSRHLLVVLAAPAARPDGGPRRWWVEEELARGIPGGLAAVKCGANHAAALFGRERARRFGYDDALWLDGRLRRDLTQSGTMNLFVALGDTVVTPPLDGNVLPGVTRACCLTLLRQWQVPVQERALAFSELVAAARAGQLREMFGTSTTTGVVPVEEVGYTQGQLRPSGGTLTGRLREALIDLESGVADDVHEWREPLHVDQTGDA
jgi:branched-chain amino acid aminotransferase